MTVSPLECLNYDDNEIARKQIDALEPSIDRKLLKDFDGKAKVTFSVASEYHPSSMVILAQRYSDKGWTVSWTRNQYNNLWTMTFSVKNEVKVNTKKERTLPAGTIDLRKKDEPKRKMDLG